MLPHWSCDGSLPNPRLYRLSHLAQPALEEMIAALDDRQLLRFGKGIDERLQLIPWPELIATAANEQFGLHARLQAGQVVGPVADRLHRHAQPDRCLNAVVAARRL